jgi:hypothetical protein
MLDGCELFMFTDNSTAERAYFKGTSSSKLLFGLVLRLRQLEMRYDCRVMLIHVAGTRMIWQGADAISRGNQNVGVMRGESMLGHAPLSQDCLARSEALKPWLESWLLSDGIVPTAKFLTPDDWPQVHPSRGVYVWTPPPAAASAAVEWLAQSIHK